MLEIVSEVVKPAAVRRSLSPRDRIFRSAAKLFAQEGIRGVGVETISFAANTTKMALYRHFDSKDSLVAEWLKELAREESAAWGEGDAWAQVVAWIDRVNETIHSPSYRGCPFINAMAEMPDKRHPGRAVIQEHKRAERERVRALFAASKRPRSEADALFERVEGAKVLAPILGPPRIEAPVSECPRDRVVSKPISFDWD